MRIYKNKAFNRWAQAEDLSDDTLRKTVDELERGLIDADLGGGLVKKRVALGGRGKRSGVRTVLAYRAGSKAFFIYGFAKREKANVGGKELKALKRYAAVLMDYGDAELVRAQKMGALIEVKP